MNDGRYEFSPSGRVSRVAAVFMVIGPCPAEVARCMEQGHASSPRRFRLHGMQCAF
jgi:hypothetical protein